MSLRLTVAAMLGAALVLPASAEQARKSDRPPARAAKPAIRPPVPRPPNILDILEAMPPAQRERVLQNLPPERRQRLIKRLEQFDSLPPQERQRLQQQLNAFRQLPPDQQQATRELFRDFNQLPPDRRRMISQEIRRLLRMDEPDRRARMDSEQYRNLYSAEERKILERRLALMQTP
jgi:hypothetical protein